MAYQKTKAERQAWWASLTPEQQAARREKWASQKGESRQASLSAGQQHTMDLARDLSVPFNPAWTGGPERRTVPCDGSDCPPWGTCPQH